MNNYYNTFKELYNHADEINDRTKMENYFHSLLSYDDNILFKKAYAGFLGGHTVRIISSDNYDFTSIYNSTRSKKNEYIKYLDIKLGFYDFFKNSNNENLIRNETKDMIKINSFMPKIYENYQDINGNIIKYFNDNILFYNYNAKELNEEILETIFRKIYKIINEECIKNVIKNKTKIQKVYNTPINENITIGQLSGEYKIKQPLILSEYLDKLVDNDIIYYQKYLKYKKKFLALKKSLKLT